MKQSRGLSDVVFRLLPDQTVDMGGAIWRVDKWVQPRALPVDVEVVRGELLRAMFGFTAQGRDGGLGNRLRQGEPIQILTPSDDEDGGVAVVPFPENYRCLRCGGIETRNDRLCSCGVASWRQLQFVAYHQCGKLATPWIRRCPEHDQVRVDYPGTTATKDLRFQCPRPGCSWEHPGFPYVRCECGTGTLSYNVHRAAVVYTPHSTVVVNPPSQEVAGRFRSEAAARQTLAWVISGMVEEDPLSARPTEDLLIADLAAKGISEEIARKMAAIAVQEQPETVASADVLGNLELTEDQDAEARHSALRLAYATAGGRTRIEDIDADSSSDAPRRYAESYRRAVAAAGLESVELLDDFPVLNAVYGYTRGGDSADAVLQAFPGGRGNIRVHGQLAHTEGLLFKLDPSNVGRWLAQRGLLEKPPETAVDVRSAVLQRAVFPRPGEDVDPTVFGPQLLTLVHSYAHRVLRRLSAFSGIDRDSLSEYLIPNHLAFVIYAATRGDFVLGGLQALFEHDLHNALEDAVHGEHRCALDPGCAKHGGACVACLHVGEPSCRYHNGFLDRDVLFGPRGYLHQG